MTRSRWMSLSEAIVNTAVGFVLAVPAQMLVLPAFDLNATMEQHLQIGAIFTVLSIARGFALRRLFEAFRPLPPGAPDPGAARSGR